MVTLSSTSVDLVPFAARAFWADAQTYEIWWDDSRDIFQVSARFAPQGVPAGIELDYWRRAWPGVRVPKGAVVGAGESGWLANDDWTSGQWQPADGDSRRQENTWTVTFRPLNQKEFPAEADFPAEFRRTLKLRLRFPAAGAQIEQVSAYSDSTWREEEVAMEWRSRSGGPENWDGRLEAFNGQVVSVRALNDCTTASSDGTWRSTVEAGRPSGVIARVRYAFNEDRNSFDKTIVTLRTVGVSDVLPGVSFLLEDALGAEPVYIRDLGLLAHRPGSPADFNAFDQAWEADHPRTLYDQIDALPEQTWERSWQNMVRKTSRMYFTLGCEGSRQKFGVDPDGALFLWENYLRRAPGKDTPLLDYPGRELRIRAGFPAAEPGDRSLLEGYLPIIRTEWADEDLAYEQEAYATWLWGTRPGPLPQGDDLVVAMLQVRFTNLGSGAADVKFPLQSVVDQKTVERLVVRGDQVSAEGGSLRFLLDVNGAGDLSVQGDQLVYTTRLAPGESHRIVLKMPHLQRLDTGEIDQLRALDYESERANVADFWRQRIAQGAQIETPNQTINNFYRTHLMHMLVINDREPGSDRNVARCGGFHYGSFPNEGIMSIVDLDRRGYHREAERCLDLYVHYQGTVPLPGNFKSQDGVFYGGGGYEVAGYNQNHGWVLWGLAEHFRFTRDRQWLERVAPALVKACQWIINERQATMQPGSIQYGFLPSGSLEDVTDFWTWLSNNAFAWWGFRAAADVLLEIGHPEAARLSQAADAFGKDVKAGFYEAAARSPVVRLRDGRWVPHFPSRLERRGRDFGWLREVLEGASHLTYTGIVPVDSLEARWIADDYEDNLFLSEGYGYQADDFDRQWFDLGGYSMQSNLLQFPPLYLGRDKPKHYLRAYFNAFTSAFFPDTLTMCEHALPDLAHWRGDHFKTSDEANSNGWLRGIFLSEEGPDLWIGKAMPRAWLAHGQKTEVQHAVTHFGEASVAFESSTATRSILVRLAPPLRNPPARIYLRLRHPEQKPMRQVWINGLPHRDFDVEKETITIRHYTPGMEVRVIY